MPHFKAHKGFSLAEILVTLGIIGIIAIITVTEIISIYQNKTNEIAFKKMYSNLQNAINMIIQENGGLAYQCYINASSQSSVTECDTFWNEIVKKLNYSSFCTGGVAGGCQPQYSRNTDVVANGGTSCNTGCRGTSTHVNLKSSYILSDGSLIMSYTSGFGGISGCFFIIDTNGFKKPNKWGYDVFALTIEPTVNDPTKVILTDNLCCTYEKDGKRINDILSN